MQQLTAPKLLKLLNENEMVLLRSWASGMNEEDIRGLIEVKPQGFDKIKDDLLTKLGVKNAYSAVTKAFRIQLLEAKEYCSESIKTHALAFAHKKIQLQNLAHLELKRELWVLYDTLIEFES